MEISQIIEKISDYFGNRDRSKQETLDGLEEIYTELEGMMACLEEELEKDKV